MGYLERKLIRMDRRRLPLEGEPHGGDASAMAGVELIAPSIGTGLESDYAALPNVTDRVDFGNVHYYSAPAYQPNLEQGVDNPGVGYFANIYRWCQAAMTPNKPLVLTACGASTLPGQSYGRHAQAAYLLNQMHDAAGIGARRFYIRTLFDSSQDAADIDGNFGLFEASGAEKPIALALAGLKHLLSLRNDYDDPVNVDDTSCFSPSYDGSTLTVSGIGQGDYSSRVSNAVVYPKSDGTTLLSVTHQPPMTDGNSNDITPNVVMATVHFGSTQSWHVYDVFADKPLAAIASGTSESVDIALYGYPMYIGLDAPGGGIP